MLMEPRSVEGGWGSPQIEKKYVVVCINVIIIHLLVLIDDVMKKKLKLNLKYYQCHHQFRVSSYHDVD
jgi:diaminopimelate epimerase